MPELSQTIAALVAKGWPRDYENVCPPCWYAFARCSPLEEPLEDSDYAPFLEGKDSVLVIAPPTTYFLYVDVSPTGALGSTRVEIHSGQGAMEDGTAGTISDWPGLDAALAEARLIYLQWEAQQLREVLNG